MHCCCWLDNCMSRCMVFLIKCLVNVCDWCLTNEEPYCSVLLRWPAEHGYRPRQFKVLFFSLSWGESERLCRLAVGWMVRVVGPTRCQAVRCRWVEGFSRTRNQPDVDLEILHREKPAGYVGVGVLSLHDSLQGSVFIDQGIYQVVTELVHGLLDGQGFLLPGHGAGCSPSQVPLKGLWMHSTQGCFWCVCAWQMACQSLCSTVLVSWWAPASWPGMPAPPHQTTVPGPPVPCLLYWQGGDVGEENLGANLW